MPRFRELPWFSLADACREKAVMYYHSTETALVLGYRGSVPCNAMTYDSRAMMYRIRIMYRGQISAWRTPTRGIERPAFVYIMYICTHIYIRFGADAKKGVHPQNVLTKRGTLLFVDREVFNVHVVVGINPTAQQDVCASTVHYSSSIHNQCIRTAIRPTACCTSTLLSKRQTYVRVTYLICAPRAFFSSKKSLTIFPAY